MTETRPSVRGGPVVLRGSSRRRRRTNRPRDALPGTEALDTPMPGRLLILLSRLSRSEGAELAATEGEDGGAPCAGPRRA